MQIQILGAENKKSEELFANARKAVEMLGVKVEVVKITDSKAIRESGAIATPALAIDGKVKTIGGVISAEEIKRLLRRLFLGMKPPES